MHCRKCGTQHSDEARFCSACGVNLATGVGSTEPGPKRKIPGCLLAILIAVAAGVVLVPLVGIVAAIAIPNFLNAIDRGKQMRTMADLRVLGVGIERYFDEHDVYPLANDIEELRGKISPDFVDVAPTVDGWQHPIEVAVTSDGYLLVSTGKDGVAGSCGRGARMTFDADICFENGQFNQWPQGSQR